MESETSCIEVVILDPVPQSFHYGVHGPIPAKGCRVRVPFGKGQRIAISLGPSPCPGGISLKDIHQQIDTEPLLNPILMELLEFGSRYYHYPLGGVWATALPTRLGRGDLPVQAPCFWQLASQPPDKSLRGNRRKELLAQIQEQGILSEEGLPSSKLRCLRQLADAGWIEKTTPPRAITPCCPGLPLHRQQEETLAQIRGKRGFHPFLLEGVTGSGKTEVYLQAMETPLAAGQQILLLVPEIGLIPQLYRRCAERFGTQHIATYHSGQSEGERLRSWSQARSGQRAIFIGTRSALFLPLPRLGMIIIDEEHDPSYKQQSGWLYSARDLGLRRAQLEKIPIILGSATPSLESLHNRKLGRFLDLRLSHRATSHPTPRIELISLRKKRLQGGLDPVLLEATASELAADHQVLFFLNRRGFAPALLCHDCGHAIPCTRCSAPLTWHRQKERLRCHHCGYEQRLPSQCPVCGSSALMGVGVGTEQLECFLRERFPHIPILRIDRDQVRSPRQLADQLEQILCIRPAILIGTQMLGKGHHFPEVTLVGIINVDQGLYSADFRASERLAQVVIQVAGRAGRGERGGRVLLQSHLPEHPLLQALQGGEYAPAAEILLRERELTNLPPYCALALILAEAHRAERVQDFLHAAQGILAPMLHTVGPIPALLERRAGWHRAYLWIEAPNRSRLHNQLVRLLPKLGELPQGRRVRWFVDVDPQNF